MIICVMNLCDVTPVTYGSHVYQSNVWSLDATLIIRQLDQTVLSRYIFVKTFFFKYKNVIRTLSDVLL